MARTGVVARMEGDGEGGVWGDSQVWGLSTWVGVGRPEVYIQDATWQDRTTDTVSCRQGLALHCFSIVNHFESFGVFSDCI